MILCPDARGAQQLDLTVRVECFDTILGLTQCHSARLSKGSRHVATAIYVSQPVIDSWSKNSILRDNLVSVQAMFIGWPVIISCHIFIVRGCGQ